jgi:hypothetical protein
MAKLSQLSLHFDHPKIIIIIIIKEEEEEVISTI